MPLIEFPFLRGQDEENDARTAPIGSLVRLENLRATRGGRLVRRRGYYGVPMTDYYTSAPVGYKPIRILERDNERAVLVDAGPGTAVATAYSSGIARNGGRSVGRLIPRVETTRLANAPGGVARHVSVARGAYYTVTAWEYRVGSYYALCYVVSDSNSGRTLSSVVEYAVSPSLMLPRVFALGGYIYIGYVISSGWLVMERLEDGGALAWSGLLTVNNTVGASSNYSWDVTTAGSNIYVATTAGAGRLLTKHTVTTSPFTVAGTDATGVAVQYGVSTHHDGTTWWVLYHANADNKVYCRIGSTNYLVNGTASAGGHRFAIGEGFSGNATIVYDAVSGAAAGLVPIGPTGTLGTLVTYTQASVPRVEWVSKPYVQDGDLWVWALTSSTNQYQDRSLVLLNGIDGGTETVRFVTASVLPRVALLGTTYLGPYVWQPAAVSASGAAAVFGAVETDAGNITTPAPPVSASPTVLRWSIDPSSAGQCVTVAGVTYVAGAVPLAYDGVNLTEAIPLWTPSVESVTTAGAGTIVGDYSYAILYTWRDSRGNVYRGAPYYINVGTLNVTSVTLPIRVTPLNSLAADGSHISVEVYRTAAGGSNYYRVGAVPIQSQSTVSVSFVDTSADTAITASQLLYTTGGVLPGHVPPGFNALCAHKGRLFGASGTLLYYTHQIIPGEGPVWPDAFVLQLQDEITGLASLDDALIVFTEHNTYALYGDGPNRLGQNAYTLPLRVPSDVGCVDWRSIVTYKDGVAFRSHRGIELLQRGGMIVTLLTTNRRSDYSAYNSTLNDNPLTFGSTCRPDHTQIRWLIGSQSFGGKTVLAYDYGRGIWSVETFPDYASCCGMWPDNMFATGYYTSAAVWAQSEDENGITSGTYLDGKPGSVTSALAYLETTDLRPGGLLGWGRARAVRVLGEYLDPQGLTLELSYNGARSWPHGNTWELDSPRVSEQTLSLRYAPPRQKCDALAVRITLAGNTSTRSLGGVALHGLSVEYESNGAGSKHSSGDRG